MRGITKINQEIIRLTLEYDQQMQLLANTDAELVDTIFTIHLRISCIVNRIKTLKWVLDETAEPMERCFSNIGGVNE